jgi:flagellar basal-body rod modification protein FlgD
MTIDTNTFLNLLVAQLKYQNPLEPQTDTAFVTQLAQMTTLEQMQQMNATLQNSQAYDMVGKYVYAEVLDTDTGITNGYAGFVNSVIVSGGIPYVVVGEEIIKVSDVIQVFDPDMIEIPDEEDEEEEEEEIPETEDPPETEEPPVDDTPETEEPPAEDTTDTGGTTDTVQNESGSTEESV